MSEAKTQRLSIKCGEVEINLPPHPRQKGWFAWPEDQNSMEALILGNLYGPFADEAEAKDFCAKNWFEVEI